MAAKRRCHILLRGEDDLASVPLLADKLANAMAQFTKLIVDLSEAQFIDSSTIKTIVTAKRAADTADRHFNLVLGTAAVVEMALKLSGVLPELNHVATLDEALGAP